MRKEFKTPFLGAFVFAALLAFEAPAHALFHMSVIPRKGGQTLRFEEGAPGSLLRNEEVAVTFESDRGVQYRISQTLDGRLTNETGNAIPQNAFIFFSPSSALGTLRTTLETPVTVGTVPLYTSNSAGESDTWPLIYSVRVLENQPERPHPRPAGRRRHALRIPRDQSLPGPQVRAGALAEDRRR